MTELKKVFLKQKEFQQFFNWQDWKTEKQLLIKFRQAIVDQEQNIYAALKKDLNKSATETFLAEYSLVIQELNYFIKHLRRLKKVHRVQDDLAIVGHRSAYIREPYGVALIMSPFNYPFQLSLIPTIGAIAAGNSVLLKLSSQTPHINAVIETIIRTVFSEELCYVIDNTTENLYADLYDLPVDIVFFTGSEKIGKQVYQNFSQHLIPVILELGGKSPVIVDGTFDIALTAKRIIWGKLMNYGQTCVAPDYIIVHQDCKQKLVDALIDAIHQQAPIPQASDHIAKIINDKQKKRLDQLMDYPYQLLYEQKIHLDEPPFQLIDIKEHQLNSPIMQHEIFGPILPIITYHDEKELWTILNHHPYPLATYIFSQNSSLIKNLQLHWKTGAIVLNTVIMHLTKHLPFGGIRNSGIGCYHQQYSFQSFSHLKPIVRIGKFDVNFMYTPHSANDLSIAKKIIFKLKKY